MPPLTKPSMNRQKEPQGGNLGLERLEQAADLLSDCLQTSVNPEVKGPKFE